MVAHNTIPRATGTKSSFFPAIVAIIVVGAVFLIVSSSFSGGVYDYEIKALRADWNSMMGAEVKVSGTVVPGSIRGDAAKLDITFDVQDAEGNKISAHYAKVLPDPFAENREVILEGTVKENYLIEANKMTVKCPSRYQDGTMSEEESQKYYRERHVGPPGYQPDPAPAVPGS